MLMEVIARAGDESEYRAGQTVIGQRKLKTGQTEQSQSNHRSHNDQLQDAGIGDVQREHSNRVAATPPNTRPPLSLRSR